MRLYEYEGKILFDNMNIPIPRNELAGTVEEAVNSAEKLGYPVMVKAQVLRGGRGKSGLIGKAYNEEDIVRISEEIINKIEDSEKVLIEKCIEITSEGYVGITVDDVKGLPVMIINKNGGMYIEDTASKTILSKLEIDPLTGLNKFQVIELALEAGYEGMLLNKISDLAYKLYTVFKKYELDTVEINPVLINEKTSEVYAGDSKVITDDYTTHRQPVIKKFLNKRDSNKDCTDKLSYVDLGGNIGIVSVGASNTMMLVDTIKYMGGMPANFLDITGSNDYETIVQLYIDLLTKFENDEKIKAVMINFTLTAQSLKNYAGTIADAIKFVKPKKKFISCLRASGAAVSDMSLQEGNDLLRNLGVTTFYSLEEAVKECVRLSKEQSSEVK